MAHRRILIVLLVAAMALMTTTAAAAEKNMVFASPYGITTLDPSVSYSTELTYMANIYETLIRVNPPGSKERFSYLLATGFNATGDGLAYTFNLRKGVKFMTAPHSPPRRLNFRLNEPRHLERVPPLFGRIWPRLILSMTTRSSLS